MNWQPARLSERPTRDCDASSLSCFKKQQQRKHKKIYIYLLCKISRRWWGRFNLRCFFPLPCISQATTSPQRGALTFIPRGIRARLSHSCASLLEKRSANNLHAHLRLPLPPPPSPGIIRGSASGTRAACHGAWSLALYVALITKAPRAARQP